MTSLSIAIKPKISDPQKILIEIDAEKFERLAANLGFFNFEFLESLKRADKDEQSGNVRKIKSLKEIR